DWGALGFTTEGSSIAYASLRAPAEQGDVIDEVRAGSALQLDADGVYQSFGANTPIIQAGVGLDAFGSIQNVVPYSQDFSNTSWVVIDAGDTKTANAATDPAGGVTLFRLTEGSANSRHGIGRSSAVSGVAGAVTTLKWIVRDIATRYVTCTAVNGST